MKQNLEKMTQEREENFKEIGRMTLQAYYYIDKIMDLCERQKKLCGKIFKLEREKKDEA